MAIGIPGETVGAGGGQVATGQQYAQQIAGGMPMSQVIAPGVSYSPDQPGGYTQADLNVIANLGIAPVMPSAPTQGPSYTIEDQMPYAPPGVTQPTPYLPPNTTVRDLTPTPEIEDYLQFIPNLVLPTDVPFAEISADTSFAPDLSQDGNFFVPNKFDLDVEAILEGVDPDKLADIDLSNLDLPQSPGRPGIDYFPEPRDPFFVKDFFEDPTASKDTAGLLDPQPGSSAPAGFIPPPSGSFNTMAFVDYYNPTTGETWSAPNGGWTAPEGWVIGRPDGGLKSTLDGSTQAPAPVMPSMPMKSPNRIAYDDALNLQQQAYEQSLIDGSARNVFAEAQQPMNFTGLPKIPKPPTTQVKLPPPPPPAYIQPRVEEIVSPIRSGSPRNFQQPGLFNLV